MSRPSHGLASTAPSYILFFCFLFLLTASAALAFDPSFDFYPTDAQPCLLDAAKASKCKGDTANELNTCLCGSGGNGGSFVVRVAQCLGRKDKKDVGSVYDTMADACAHSSTPLKVDKDDFVDIAGSVSGNGRKSSSSSSSSRATATKTSSLSASASQTLPASASSTTSSATTSSTASAATFSTSFTAPSPLESATTPATASATTSSTASPTASPASGSGSKKEGGSSSSSKHLSTAGTIGIAVGVSIAGVLAIAGLVWLLVRRRKRNAAVDEAHPMLPHEKYGGGGGGGATTFPPHEPSSPSLASRGGVFDREAQSQHSVSTFSSSAYPPPQSYAALPSASPDPQQQQQHNFLSAWEPPSATSYHSSTQYVGSYAASQQQQAQPAIAELPPRTRTRPASNVFELESRDSTAVTPSPPPQAASQSTWQQQQPPGEYRPYMPK